MFGTHPLSMTSVLRVLICSLLIGVLSFLCPAPSQAQSPSFDRLMRQGYDALLTEDYSTALQQFTAAQQISPEDPYVLTAVQNVERVLSEIDTSLPQPDSPVLPFLPLDLGAPSNRTSAGIRSRCSALETAVGPKLTALAPQLTGGTTLDAHPTLLFFIPQTVARQVDFALSDADQQVIYRQSLTLTQAPGIIRIQIPPEIAPLTVGETYRWGLELVCDLEDPAKNATVIGSIQRVSLPGTSALLQESLDPQQQLTLQQIQGIWFDVVASLAQFQENSPDDLDLKSAWTTVLAQEQLEAIAQEPLLSCCQP